MECRSEEEQGKGGVQGLSQPPPAQHLDWKILPVSPLVTQQTLC